MPTVPEERTMSDTIDGYAEALLAVVRAEGDTGASTTRSSVSPRRSKATTSSATRCPTPTSPAETRQQIVEDLLGGKARTSPDRLVSMVVGAGRAAELPAIARALVARGRRRQRQGSRRGPLGRRPDRRPEGPPRRIAQARHRQAMSSIKVTVDPSRARRRRHHRSATPSSTAASAAASPSCETHLG